MAGSNSSTTRGPDSDTVWVGLILAAIAVAAAAAGVLWLAVAVDDLRAGRPRPGNPVPLARAVLTGHHPAPSVLGWVAAAMVVVLVVAGVAAVISGGLHRSRGRRETVDTAGRHLARGRALRRLSAQAVLKTAARLGSAVGPVPGPLLGVTVTGGQALYVTCEMVVLVVAGTRSGKSSAFAIPWILDAPGPVLATSNKPDLVENTAAVRALAGRVWVFDPQQLAGGAPDWWWNPLAEVHGLTEAEYLADHFAEDARNPRTSGDSYFDGAARSLLAALLLAAALDERPITAVHTWLTSPGSDEAVRLLRTAGQHPVADALGAVVHAPDRQRAGVFGTALQMVSCLTNPAATRWVIAPPGPAKARHFDPAAFVTSSDTLYSLSREGRGSAGALVTALTVAVTQAAEREATRHPGGRLSVPLTGVLDEAANVCRWRDLPALYSHYGSRGILLSTFVQSPSQGVQLWGEQGWATLRDSANVLVYAGGVKDRDFLSELSDLIGTYERPTDSVNQSHTGRSTSRSTRREPILDTADLAALPLGRAVVLVSGSKATLVRTRPYFDGPHAAAVTAARAGTTGEELHRVVLAAMSRSDRRAAQRAATDSAAHPLTDLDAGPKNATPVRDSDELPAQHRHDQGAQPEQAPNHAPDAVQR